MSFGHPNHLPPHPLLTALWGGCHQPYFTDEYTEAQSSGGGVGNEFQTQWLPESGPSHSTGFSDFVARIPKEEGNAPPAPPPTPNLAWRVLSALLWLHISGTN